MLDPIELLARDDKWYLGAGDGTVTYKLDAGITSTEVRTVHPGGVFVSEWRFASFAPVRIHLVAWTAQDGATVPMGEADWKGAVRFPRVLRDRREQPLRVRAELACVGEATSWAAYRSEKSAPQPYWRFTP